MHSHISHAQFLLWLTVLSVQILVGTVALLRHNRTLALYLAIEAANSLTLLLVARTGSAVAYYHAFVVGTGVDYLAMALLVALIYRTIRETGIPGHGMLLQVMAGCLFAVAIFAAPFPLQIIAHPQWKTVMAVDRVFFNWLSFLLIAAPLYAWMVDAAKDSRLLLIYLGLALYVAVHLGALEIAMVSRKFSHASSFTYFLSLVLWCCSSLFQPANHQLNPALTEFLKEALRRKANLSTTNDQLFSERVRSL